MRKLKKNEFKCFICGKTRIRGHFVRGKQSGHVSKICKTLKCVDDLRKYDWGIWK